MIQDIHSHKTAYYPEGIINWDPITNGYKLLDGQPCSLGIHPWHAGDARVDAAFERMAELATLEEVKLIGECGVDIVKGEAPLYQQLLLFKRHIELSESLGKPLLIHEVRAHDVIVGLRKEYRCRQPWIVHGFRGKPSVAQMLLRSGCSLSFGESVNSETVAMVPSEHLFVETDESPLPIAEVIARISHLRGEDIIPTLSANLTRILNR